MSHRTGVWVPNQHGAWAMLAVPLIAGSVLRSPPDAVASLLLSGCFVLGYFGFFAASQWLKSPPRRRGRHLPPLLVYTSASAVLGLLALARTGPALLGWTPVFAPLLVPALWLARRHNERALVGGALTTAAACLMTLALAHDSPAAVLADWPDARTATFTGLALFGYFFGTVLHVKSLIRERGNSRIEAASLLWHLAWTLAPLPAWGLATLVDLDDAVRPRDRTDDRAAPSRPDQAGPASHDRRDRGDPERVRTGLRADHRDAGLTSRAGDRRGKRWPSVGTDIIAP